MTRAAIIYARFSTTEQSKGYSLERQKSAAVEFSAKRDWVVEKIITDEGRSAFHAKNRAEGSALYEFELEARNGVHRGKVLLVENIDRLSRQGAKAAAQLIWALNEAGVDVATYHDGYIYQADNNSDMMELFSVIIKAQLAFEESDKKSKRTKASWDNRFNAIENGEKIPEKVPHVPNWINRVDGQYVLDEGRTKLLNEIYDFYIDGVGIHRIVTMLNERGEPDWSHVAKKQSQGGWFYSYIYRLLTKRAVLGEYVTGDGRILATDFYPQAITAEKFNRAQAVLKLRKSNQKRTGEALHRNLLTQLVYCSECGGGAHFEHTTNSVQRYTKISGEVVEYRRKTYRRLRCDRARRKHSCDSRSVINYDTVERTVLDYLAVFAAGPNGPSPEIQQLNERIAENARVREAKTHQLNSLIDALAQGDSRAVMQRVVLLEGAIDQLDADLAHDTQQRDILLSIPDRADEAEGVERIREEINDPDPDIRHYARSRINMALRRLIDRIDLNSDSTFRAVVNDGMSVTFDKDGKPIGFTANGKHINDKILDGLLSHDYDVMASELIAQMQPTS